MLDSEHSQVGFFTEEHLHLLTTIASMTASRISRALLDEQLQDVRRVTDSIIETALDAIVTVDVKGRVIAFNRAAQSIFRCSASDALLQPLSRFLPGYDVSGAPQGLIELTGVCAERHAGPRGGLGLPRPRSAESSSPPSSSATSPSGYVPSGKSRLNQGLEVRHRRADPGAERGQPPVGAAAAQRVAPAHRQRLKRGEQTIAERFEDVTVLFADLVGFTRWAGPIPPEQVVEVLGHVFTAFDALTARHGLEKIKTIGDAYMVAAGVPAATVDHRERVARMALEVLETLNRISEAGGRSTCGSASTPVRWSRESSAPTSSPMTCGETR